MRLCFHSVCLFVCLLAQLYKTTQPIFVKIRCNGGTRATKETVRFFCGNPDHVTLSLSHTRNTEYVLLGAGSVVFKGDCPALAQACALLNALLVCDLFDATVFVGST